MKNQNSIRVWLATMVICALTSQLYAEVVRLAEKDDTGQSSLVDGSRWSPAGVPASDHDYLVEGLTIRTPDRAAASTTFNGHSLQIGVIGGGKGKVLAKGNGSSVTYSNLGLYLANGSYAAGANNMTASIYGKLTVLSPAADPFAFTSEYTGSSGFSIYAEVVSSADTKLAFSGTSNALRNFVVGLYGDLSGVEGTLAVVHDEVTVALADQTIPGTVVLETSGATLTTIAANDRPSIGTLNLAAAGAVLKVKVGDGRDGNGVLRVTKSFSSASGIVVKFDGPAGFARYARSRYPLIEFAPAVTDEVNPTDFVEGDPIAGSVRLAFAVERGEDGSRTLYAYPRMNVLDVVDDEASLSVSQPVAAGSALEIVMEGTKDLFSGAAIHLDASDDASVTRHFDESRTAQVVTAWNGVKPYEVTRTNDPKVRALPTYRTVSINGVEHQVVDFGEWFSAFTGSPADTCTASAIRLDSIVASEFYGVVADTDAKGRTVLGFGYKNPLTAPDKYPFRRDGAKILNAAKTDSTESLVNGSIFVDGASATASYEPGLNEFHVYGFVPTQAVTVNAIAAGYYDGFGGVQVGELVAFSRVNSSARQQAIRRVLQRKWLGAGPYLQLPLSDVAVAGCGTLVLSTESVCSVVPSALTLTADAEGGLSAIRVAGACEIPASGTLRIVSNGSGKIAAGDYEILTADTLIGAENIASWTIDSGVPNVDSGILLSVEGNKIVLHVPARGLLLIFR